MLKAAMPTVSHRKQAPGPPGQLLLGHLREFRRDVLQLLMDAAREFGDVVRFRLGPHVIHLLNHPEHVEHVLQRGYERYDKSTRSAAKMRSVCGESLLTTDGAFWRRQRQLTQPIFHPRRVDDFAPVMTEATATMLSHWRSSAESGRPLDIASEMMHLTYTIVGKTLFSADVRSEVKAVEEAAAVVLEHCYHRLQRLWDPPEWFLPWRDRRFREARQTIDRVVYRLIEEHRDPTSERRDMLSLLLAAEEAGAARKQGTMVDGQWSMEMSDAQVRNETLTLLLSGHETTANALTWTFSLLSRFPAVEHRLRAELVEVLGGRTPGPEDVARLQYTTMVLHEALRLYPPIWVMERRATGEDEIGGYFIPADSTVVISPYVLHRHPAFWEHAEVFDPERFRDPHPSDGPRRAYLPFGAGPHHCIGSSFAMLEARLILAMVVQEYHLSLVPGHSIEPQPGITLRPRSGLLMTVHR